MKVSNLKFQVSKGGLKFEIWHLIFVFVLLGLTYSVITPIFEAPDEPWHFNYVRYVAEGRGLPSLKDNESGAYQEVGQPPLYYLVAGLVVAPVGEFDTRGLALHNPGFGYQAPGTVNDNKNLMAHTGREAFPWRGVLLAIHLARLFSLASGALTVLATWGLAREVFPESPFIALAAAAVVGFTPQFLFVSSVTSNDSSAAALSTAALWTIARMARLGVTIRRAAWAGLLVGLASLTKSSTVLLGVLVVATIVVAPHSIILSRAGLRPSPEGAENLVRVEQRPSAAARLRVTRLARLQCVAVMMIVALIVGGWWYARNGILYGDPLGLSVHLNTPWRRPAPVSLMQVLPTLPLAYRSFWGAFGWGNVEMSLAIYYVLAVVIVASGIGWLRSVRKQTPGNSWAVALCALWCGVIFISFLQWNQQVEALHGRLLFPALGAFALLLVAGLAQLPRSRAVIGIIAAGYALLSLATPFIYIRPAYAWPDLFPPDQMDIRHSTREVVIRHLLYGDEAHLISFELDRPSVVPGEWLKVTLCWMAVKPMTRNYTLFIHLLGRENRIVGARNTWPGLGRFPTSLWPQGFAFCDTTPVRVETTAPVPEVYAIEVGLYEAKTNDRLEAVDASTGQPVLPPIVGRVRIAPKEPLRVSAQYSAHGDFGSTVLMGYDLLGQARPGDSVPLTLYWRSAAKMDKDYTVFIHLLDASGKLTAQGDAEPRGGAYPTSAWAAGDVIPDEHILKLPDHLALGDYVIRVGLYLAPDGPRLSLKPSGDSFALGVLHVR